MMMPTHILRMIRQRRLWQHSPAGYLPVDMLERKGRLLFLLGRFDQAREVYLRVVGQLRPLGETAMLGEFIYQLCCTLYSTGHYDECGPLLDEAERAFTVSGARGGSGRVLGLRGNIAADRGRIAEAMTCYQGKLDIARQTGDTDGIVNTLSNLAGVYFAQGKHDQAMRYLQEQLALATSYDLQDNVCIALGNIALMHSVAHDYRAALEYCQRQLALAVKIGDKVGIGYAMDNLGQTRMGLGEHIAAEDNFREELRLAQELGDRYMVYLAGINIGTALIRQGRTADARPSLERAVAMAAELGLPVEARKLILLSEARLAAGDAAGARVALGQADAAGTDGLDDEWLGRISQLRQQIAETR